METMFQNPFTTFTDFVGAVSFHIIINWVSVFHWLCSKFLCFFQPQFEFVENRANNGGTGTSEKVSTQQQFCLKEKAEDDIMISREDIEMEMAKMGMFFDADDGTLTEWFNGEEFCCMFVEMEPSLEEVKEAFSVFDINRDGYIDAKDLQRVLCNLGMKEALNLNACERMIGSFDRNRDGRIDFSDFLKLLENSFG